MKRILLVNPPRSYNETFDIAPPLGLLRLASIAQAHGWEAEILDLNLLIHSDKRLRGEQFYENVDQMLFREDWDVFAYTSMAVDSHVALELARRTKKRNPGARCVFGGSHFSTIASDVMALCPWVDHVFMGEAEVSFGHALDILGKQGQTGRLQRVVPMTIETSTVAPQTLTSQYATFDLQPYFDINDRRTIDFEAGRGCVYRCSFCYSPSHYTGPRTFDMRDVIDGLHHLQNRGAERVFFVEDNFLNFPSTAEHLLDAIAESGLALRWGCYATLPQLTPKLLEKMARAGCTDVFLGVCPSIPKTACS